MKRPPAVIFNAFQPAFSKLLCLPNPANFQAPNTYTPALQHINTLQRHALLTTNPDSYRDQHPTTCLSNAPYPPPLRLSYVPSTYIHHFKRAERTKRAERIKRTKRIKRINPQPPKSRITRPPVPPHINNLCGPLRLCASAVNDSWKHTFNRNQLCTLSQSACW